MEKESFTFAQTVAVEEMIVILGGNQDSNHDDESDETVNPSVLFHDCLPYECPSAIPRNHSATAAATTTTAAASTAPYAFTVVPSSSSFRDHPERPTMGPRCYSHPNVYRYDLPLEVVRSSPSLTPSVASQHQQQQHQQQLPTTTAMMMMTTPTTTNLNNVTTTTTTGTSMSGRMEDVPLLIHHRKRDLLLGYSLLFVTSLATAVLNAAITIFGMGLGLGLILGETMRDDTNSTTTGTSGSSSTLPSMVSSSLNRSDENDNDDDEGEDVEIYPSTPTCRATVQRISTRRSSSSTRSTTTTSTPRRQPIALVSSSMTMPAQ